MAVVNVMSFSVNNLILHSDSFSLSCFHELPEKKKVQVTFISEVSGVRLEVKGLAFPLLSPR